MVDTLQQKINNIIDNLKSIHDEDPPRIEQLDAITNLLMENEKQTIELLRSCDDEQIIFWIATSLDEVASKFPSNDLLGILESLCIKFLANKMLVHNFQMAIDSM